MEWIDRVLDPTLLAELWQLLRAAVQEVIPAPWDSYVLAAVPLIVVLGLLVRFVINPLRGR